MGIDDTFYYDPLTGVLGIYVSGSDNDSYTKFEKDATVTYDRAGKRTGFDVDVYDIAEVRRIRNKVSNLLKMNRQRYQQNSLTSAQIDELLEELG